MGCLFGELDGKTPILGVSLVKDNLHLMLAPDQSTRGGGPPLPKGIRIPLLSGTPLHQSQQGSYKSMKIMGLYSAFRASGAIEARGFLSTWRCAAILLMACHSTDQCCTEHSFPTAWRCASAFRSALCLCLLFLNGGRVCHSARWPLHTSTSVARHQNATR